jgi:hypothetical protein
VLEPRPFAPLPITIWLVCPFERGLASFPSIKLLSIDVATAPFAINLPAFLPKNILLPPLIRLNAEAEPKHIFSEPDVLLYPAFAPMKILSPPVVLFCPAEVPLK